MPARQQADDDASKRVRRSELRRDLLLGLLDESLGEVVERPDVRLDCRFLARWRTKRGEEGVELGDDGGGC